jgi:hypothetical protein
MIRTLSSMCADLTIVDRQTNNLSIINVIDQITALSYPVGLNRIALVFVMQRDQADPGRANVEFLVRHNDVELSRFTLLMDFEAGLVTRVLPTIQGFVIPSAGVLRFSLHLNGAELNTVSVNAIQGPPQLTPKPLGTSGR